MTEGILTQVPLGEDEKAVLAFEWHSQAVYANTSPLPSGVVDEIMIGRYYPSGGTNGEFCIRWEKLMGRVVARMYAYDDSWEVLSTDSAPIMNVLRKMASDSGESSRSPKEFVAALLEEGFVDFTKKPRPWID